MSSQTENPPIKIIIVEDQKEVREGLRYLLSLDARIRVLKAFDRADSLLESLPALVFPDIVLMDIGLPGLNGIDAIRRLKKSYPQINVIVFTVFEDEETLLESIHAGANGYILKNTKPELLLEQIISAASGGAPISPRVARRLLEEIQRTNEGDEHENYGLTGRETQILRLIVDGLTYREIAGRYSIAASTVKKHILHIYQKLGVRTKAEFVRKAIQEKLV
jgi:DNA-binding NarL/FixJ family response regulator